MKKLVPPSSDVWDFRGLKKVLPPDEDVLPDVDVFCFAPKIPVSTDCTVFGVVVDVVVVGFGAGAGRVRRTVVVFLRAAAAAAAFAAL